MTMPDVVGDEFPSASEWRFQIAANLEKEAERMELQGRLGLAELCRKRAAFNFQRAMKLAEKE